MQTVERLASLLGSWMPMDGAKLLDIVDDGNQAWLVFDHNLVILRKDVLQKRGNP